MYNKSNSYNVGIIGGGAAGLFCASIIKMKAPHLSVAVIERQKDIGKKLLATGNGRCNLTNLNADTNMYHGSFSEGVANLLKLCPPASVIDIFKEFGLITTCDSEGRVYPYSKHSASVLDCLRLACKEGGVSIICDSHVKDVNICNNAYQVITQDDDMYLCEKLIIASGSKATPETGADDSLLNILSTKFDHTITPSSPALCPVRVKSKSLHALKGVRATGQASIMANNKIFKTEQGEIQFTEKALSGICIFNLSRIANTRNNTTISLALLPHMSEQEITEYLTNKQNKLSNDSTAEVLLCGVFQNKLNNVLLKEAGISKDKKVHEIKKSDITKLADIINNWCFEVIPSDDFTRAQVVAGGVSGSEINPLTMESKINKNLYIIGEAIDCDGDCGGLNLQFAFSSAYCAACDLTK